MTLGSSVVHHISRCISGRKVEMGTGSRDVVHVQCRSPHQPAVLCSVLVWSYGAIRDAWRMHGGLGSRNSKAHRGQAGCTNAGVASWCQQQTEGPKLPQRGQASVFFRPNGAIGTQKSSEIPNRVTSVETSLSLNITGIQMSRHSL